MGEEDNHRIQNVDELREKTQDHLLQANNTLEELWEAMTWMKKEVLEWGVD